MKKLIEEAQLEPEYSEELIQDTAVDDLVEPQSRTEQEQAVSKKEDSKKSNDKNHRDERNSNKRSRTGATAVTHTGTFYPLHINCVLIYRAVCLL